MNQAQILAAQRRNQLEEWRMKRQTGAPGAKTLPSLNSAIQKKSPSPAPRFSIGQAPVQKQSDKIN
jgi:hypothetical protein